MASLSAVYGIAMLGGSAAAMGAAFLAQGFNPIDKNLPVDGPKLEIAPDVNSSEPPVTVGGGQMGGYFEQQDDVASCGRHSVNHLLGKPAYAKTGTIVDISKSPGNFVRNIDMTAFCQSLEAEYTKRHGVQLDGKSRFECRANENYDASVLVAAVNMFGYKKLDQQLNKDDISKINESKNFQFLINLGETTGGGATGLHWVAAKTERPLNIVTKNIKAPKNPSLSVKYYDSLEPKEREFATIKLFKDFLKNKNVTFIYQFDKKSGVDYIDPIDPAPTPSAAPVAPAAPTPPAAPAPPPVAPAPPAPPGPPAAPVAPAAPVKAVVPLVASGSKPIPLGPPSSVGQAIMDRMKELKGLESLGPSLNFADYLPDSICEKIETEFINTLPSKTNIPLSTVIEYINNPEHLENKDIVRNEFIDCMYKVIKKSDQPINLDVDCLCYFLDDTELYHAALFIEYWNSFKKVVGTSTPPSTSIYSSSATPAPPYGSVAPSISTYGSTGMYDSTGTYGSTALSPVYGSSGMYGSTSVDNVNYSYSITPSGVYMFKIPTEAPKFKNIYNESNNLWNENFKDQFTSQHAYFINKYKLNDNFPLFIKSSGVPTLNEYSEKVVKDIANKSSFFDSTGRLNVFSVSLFMKPGASYNKRNIKVGGMSMDDYYMKTYKGINGKTVWNEIGERQSKRETRDILTYFEILFKNITLYQARYPKWIVRLYTDKSISQSSDPVIQGYYNELVKKNIQIIECTFTNKDVVADNGFHGGIATMLSRFFPMFDPTVNRYLTIEADNWPTDLYFSFIDKWISSNKLSLSFLASSPYGWPSGEIETVNGKETIVYFRQNYGGMFGLSKPNGMIYNPEFFNILFTFSQLRKDIFNRNYFNGDIPKFPTEFYGLLKNKIKYLLDFGVDEVWLSLFVLPKISEYDDKQIYAIPVDGDGMNWNKMSLEDKKDLAKKLNINSELAEVDDPTSIFRWIDTHNKNISTALEIAIIEDALSIKDYGLNIDKKYSDTFVTSFNNLYPGWDYTVDYDKLTTTLDQIKSKSIDFTDTFLLEKSKTGGAISTTSLQQVWDAYELRSKYLRSFIEFGPFDKDGNSTITYDYLDRCKKLVTVILGKKLYLKNNSELDTDINISQKIFDIIKTQANSERNVKILKTLQWLSRIKNVGDIDFDSIGRVVKPAGIIVKKQDLADVNSFINSQLVMSLSINEILNILRYELESRGTPGKLSTQNVTSIVKDSAYPWFQFDKNFTDWLLSLGRKSTIEECDLVKLFAKSSKNPCISLTYQLWKFKDVLYLLGYGLESIDQRASIDQYSKSEKVLVWLKTTEEVDSITPGEVESITKQYKDIITPKTIITVIAMFTKCGMKFSGKKAVLSFATAPLILEPASIQLLRWAFSCNLDKPIPKSDIDRLPKYGIELEYVQKNFDTIIAYSGFIPKGVPEIITTIEEQDTNVVKTPQPGPLPPTIGMMIPKPDPSLPPSTPGSSTTSTGVGTETDTSTDTATTGTNTPGEENAVTKLLKQISGDINNRTCEQKDLAEQSRAIEIRKLVREEIERQKKSPAAKVKADYAQAKREELMKYTVETAKQALPSEDELAKDPAFLGKVKAKLAKDQADKFDALFKDAYPDLYKIQTDKDKSDSSQGAKWIWPSFVTKDQKTKIIDMIKANKDIKLQKIKDELKWTEEQKKEFLDKSWQKGIKDSILKGKTEPETTSVSGSTTVNWPAGVTDQQKTQILEEVKSERDPGKVLPKIVGLSDDLKGEIRKVWRDILPPKPKKGGATIRRPLKGGRTVRHV